MATSIRSLMEQRAPYGTSQGRRIRALFYAFLAKLNPDDPLQVAAVPGVLGGPWVVLR
jgi:hypothetical protein